MARALDYRATVDRAYVIDRAYERAREIERDAVTPVMRRIESADPGRHLAGLENRLKSKERLTEKVENWVSAQPDLQPADAFRLVKDTIRYTFVYDASNYTASVYADCDRLESSGFEPLDRRNSWEADQYKGINGRWREQSSRSVFEIQFHTQESLDAKEATHGAYERIRDPETSSEQVRQLKDYQRQVCAKVPIPPGAAEVPDYDNW